MSNYALLLPVLSLILSTVGCQSVQTAITGNVFKKAPEGSPRVEAELVVLIDDGLFDDFADSSAQAELESDIRDIALSRADLGLRLYPVASESYSVDSARPPYALTIRIAGLRVLVETETFKTEERGSFTRDVVGTVECRAQTSLEKRRPNAPALKVAVTDGDKSLRAERDADDLALGRRYWLTRSADEEPLEILREDVLKAIDSAVITALRQMLPAADRELATP